MSIACVIGNGPSRLQFDLQKIGQTMTTYGCNALYRDYIPNYLIAMDLPMVKEILEKDIHLQTTFYTQHQNQIDKLQEDGEPINFFWGQKETQDSGNSALSLSLMNKHDTVYMIGFDYSENPSVLPNVYSGTVNYTPYHMFPAASMRETQWIQRLNKILSKYADQKVIRVVGTKSLNVNKSNYREITPEQFCKIYE